MRSTFPLTLISAALVLMTGLVSTAEAQTATFSRFNDAAAGCYEPTGTTAAGNTLVINMVNCTASAPNGTVSRMDTFHFYVEAPAGYFVTRITFTQSGTTAGARGGRGFYGVSWVADHKAMTGTGSVDLSLQRKTVVPVSLTTYLAAFGIQVVSGSASATNPRVLVELAPL